MDMKEKIRPVYLELRGYLSQIPEPAQVSDAMYDPAVWEQYNTTIVELNTISSKNYDRFKIVPEQGHSSEFLRILTYRQKLGGLISRLHGDFFSDEPLPFGGMPTTVISQNQQQAQSQQIQMLLEIQSKIDEKIPILPESSKEKTFLRKVKESLTSVGNVTQLIALLLKTAKDLGLTVEQIYSLFK